MAVNERYWGSDKYIAGGDNGMAGWRAARCRPHSAAIEPPHPWRSVGCRGEARGSRACVPLDPQRDARGLAHLALCRDGFSEQLHRLRGRGGSRAGAFPLFAAGRYTWWNASKLPKLLSWQHDGTRVQRVLC